MADWRLQGQERYLTGAMLHWRRWVPYRKDWDHDHCEFCMETISPFDGDLPVGYTTADQSRWICERCFEDFSAPFGWKVATPNPAPGES